MSDLREVPHHSGAMPASPQGRSATRSNYSRLGLDSVCRSADADSFVAMPGIMVRRHVVSEGAGRQVDDQAVVTTMAQHV